ncbi:MAG: hypothetical protein A2W28_02725 [Gammaproteobacteria bacterium RBG_16_51_14]|nr:MAG: hypothetical protein A2W28_02725 [Gammaproteobacteria bacterium RBG_16_51_14]
MSMLRKLIGPKSKYDKSIPYTYEARAQIIEGLDKYNYYLSDTICGLIEYLEKNGIQPDEVVIYEVYQDKEKEIQREFYTTEKGGWLYRPEICQSFEQHYKGHIHKGECSFADRERKGIGP